MKRIMKFSYFTSSLDGIRGLYYVKSARNKDKTTHPQSFIKVDPNKIERRIVVCRD